MVIREELVQELSQLNEQDVQRVANFVSLLKSAARTRTGFAESDLEVLYAEAGEEDRLLAQEGMAEYAIGLKKEDTQ